MYPQERRLISSGGAFVAQPVPSCLLELPDPSRPVSWSASSSVDPLLMPASPTGAVPHSGTVFVVVPHLVRMASPFHSLLLTSNSTYSSPSASSIVAALLLVPRLFVSPLPSSPLDVQPWRPLRHSFLYCWLQVSPSLLPAAPL